MPPFRYRVLLLLTLLLLIGVVLLSGRKETPGKREYPKCLISREDSLQLNRFWDYAHAHRIDTLSRRERVAIIGRFFMDTPYKGGTLEIHEQEQLVINLRELDCVTFVDNVLALTFVDQYGTKSIPNYLRYLQKIRYRDGIITDYTSRLHYSTDWLYEMQRQQLLTDVTLSCGGIPFPVKVGYISRHHSAYPALVRDTTLIVRIEAIEKAINQRKLHYIPKENIAILSGQIQHGDIILITTKQDGLDTGHVGIAWEENGKIYLLHASSSQGKVVITSLPLHHYLMGVSSFSGVLVGRQC